MNKCLITILFLAFSLAAAAQNTQYRDTLETSKGTAYNPGELLKGRVSGVRVFSLDGNVNGDTYLNIRGLNTIRGDSQPLWIVDGAILTTAGNQNTDAFWQYGEMSYSSTLNSMAYLSPYDIESIEVVKDVSETARYGKLGANGVIIVKTKFAKSRELNVRYQGNVSLGFANKSADIFKTSLSHNHYVTVNGKIKGSNYYISGYYRKVDGVAKNQGADYGGAMINYETKANSALWFGFHSTLSFGGVSNVTGPSYYGQPSMLMLGRNPYLFPLNSKEGWIADYDDNAEDARTTNSMFLVINFSPKLHLKTNIGVDYRNLTRKIWFGNGTSFGKDMNGAASILSSSLFNYNASIDLAYSTFLGKAGKLSAEIDIDAMGNINRFNTMNGTNFFTHALRAEGLSLMGSKAEIHSFDTQYFCIGSYAKVAYDFISYAGVSALLRADTTPAYDNWAIRIYPSVDAFVDFKRIALSRVKTISSLKLTGGYGKSGRESYVPYQLFDVWLTGNYPIAETGQDCYFDALNIANTEEFNVGVSLGLFDERFYLSAKYFNKSTFETFTTYDSSTKNASGMFVRTDRVQTSLRNAGFKNRGYEFDIGGKPVKSGKVSLSIDANFTICANQVIEVDSQEIFGKKVGSGFCANANVVGFSVGQLYGYYENQDGSYRDLNGDGIVSESDKGLLGSTLPKFYGGLTAVLEVGHFTLDLLFDGAAGHKIANLNDAITDRRDVLSESYVEIADFLRLSHVACSYTFPMKANWIQSIKVSLTGQNLFTISSYSGWNPDVNCFGRSVLSQGLDYGSYPITRSAILGVNFIF